MAEIPDILEGFNQVINLMPWNGADIFKFKSFEKHAGCKKTLKALLTFFQDLQNVLPDIGK